MLHSAPTAGQTQQQSIAANLSVHRIILEIKLQLNLLRKINYCYIRLVLGA